MPTVSLCTKPSQEPRTTQATSLLLLGCSPAMRADSEKGLAGAGIKTTAVDTAAAALEALARKESPILVDFAGGAATLQLIRGIRAVRPGAVIFALVDESRPDLVTEAVFAGVAELFVAPLDADRLARVTAREKQYQALETVGVPATRADDLYAFSASMREIKAQIARVAPMRGGVLIGGEAGTGRQLVARAVHAASGRPGAFVAVDFASGDNDAAAEIFGVSERNDENLPVRGFERVSQTSRLYAALGGTLYLKNLPEAPTRLQNRLARLLRDREAVIVETGETVTLDVRVMAATDARLESSARDGRVQDDLFRRLSTSRVTVPSLRDRREDIPALANFFLRAACAAAGTSVKPFARSALSLMAALPWPGNATELEQLLRTIVSGGHARGIALEDLLAHVRLDGGSSVSAHGGTLRQARARFEQQYITAILRQHQGRITQAAQALGIQRTNLYRKMRTLNVSQTRHR